jgi:ATP-dependent helicase HepA
MHNLIQISTPQLSAFLTAKLSELTDEWWQKHVVERLSFQQQRMVEERRYATLQQLDFAALLRVLDQNWHELSYALSLPREGRTWVKELQTVRNKWAHLSAEKMPASEVYRDADTLGRFLAMIGGDQTLLNSVESTKAVAVAAMVSLSEVLCAGHNLRE